MEILFLCVIIFLFVLAVFDLTVGVSNDAVNFMNSALGSGAASFKRVVIVASVGVFIGAAMSNGMMDIARHGIFRPEHFTFYDLLCIFMAVMVTDILLLDLFNTLGMPTSTTVSMVFELLGAAFTVALIKMAGGLDMGLGQLLNTEKAFSVILGIFLSVAIAFVFGTLVQFLSRLIFAFDYRSRLKWKIGIFGGLCATAIIYFLIIKGAKDLTFMTPQVKEWIAAHTLAIIGACLVFFTLFMQLLHALGVNVLKVVVLMGTFALAMAFAGNDLVNFIGVPLSGLASWQDWSASGADPDTHLMGALNGPSDTPVWFLIGAGLVMVVSLATSRKARNVTKTEIGLGSQQGGDEMFGSSRIARRLVRWSLTLITAVRNHTPLRVRRWLARRFDTDLSVMAPGAAFDLIRASVNLVLAGALIAAGTSLKLPLSTTFVTFMVAMGTSLADRAWSRESAVFRITGVISVIGGWFVTAGVAFIGAGIVVALMHLGGIWVMMALALLVIVLLVRSNRRFSRRNQGEEEDALFSTMLSTTDRDECWNLLRLYITEQHQKFLSQAADSYATVTEAFARDDAKALRKTESLLTREKAVLKNMRRKQTLCLRRLSRQCAIEVSASFHLANSCCISILYNLRRITEICREHVDNNFNPLPPTCRPGLEQVRDVVSGLYADTLAIMASGTPDGITALRDRCERCKDELSALCADLHTRLREGNPQALSVLYVYLNTMQESREMVSSLRKYLRAWRRLTLTDSCTR